MKKFLLVLLVPLVVSAAAIAAPNPASSSAFCKNLQQTASALFGTGTTYANLGACVKVKTTQAAQNTANAAKTCTAERALNPAAFATKYGTNASKKNAFGKCVSATATAATAAQQTAELNAAKTCKAERALNPAAFATKYGTNANKKNAFGKCVSKLAKAQQS